MSLINYLFLSLQMLLIQQSFSAHLPGTQFTSSTNEFAFILPGSRYEGSYLLDQVAASNTNGVAYGSGRGSIIPSPAELKSQNTHAVQPRVINNNYNNNNNNQQPLDKDALIYPSEAPLIDSYGNPINNPYTTLSESIEQQQYQQQHHVQSPSLASQTPNPYGSSSNINGNNNAIGNNKNKPNDVIGFMTDVNKDQSYQHVIKHDDQQKDSSSLTFLLPSYASGITQLQGTISGTKNKPTSSLHAQQQQQQHFQFPLSSGNFNYPSINQPAPHFPSSSSSSISTTAVTTTTSALSSPISLNDKVSNNEIQNGYGTANKDQQISNNIGGNIFDKNSPSSLTNGHVGIDTTNNKDTSKFPYLTNELLPPVISQSVQSVPSNKPIIAQNFANQFNNGHEKPQTSVLTQSSPTLSSYSQQSTVSPSPSTAFSKPFSDFSQQSNGFSKPIAGLPAPSTAFSKPFNDFSQQSNGFSKPIAGLPSPSTAFSKPFNDFSQQSNGFSKPIAGLPSPSTAFSKPFSDFSQQSNGFSKPSTGFPSSSTGSPKPYSDFSQQSNGFSKPSTGFSQQPSFGFSQPSYGSIAPTLSSGTSSTFSPQFSNPIQKPSYDKYTGGFGGAPGILGNQEKPGYAIQPTIASPSSAPNLILVHQDQFHNNQQLVQQQQQHQQPQQQQQIQQQQQQHQQQQHQQPQQQQQHQPQQQQQQQQHQQLQQPQTPQQQKPQTPQQQQQQSHQPLQQQLHTPQQQPQYDHTLTQIKPISSGSSPINQSIHNQYHNDKYTGGFGGPPGILSPYDNIDGKRSYSGEGTTGTQQQQQQHHEQQPYGSPKKRY